MACISFCASSGPSRLCWAATSLPKQAKGDCVFVVAAAGTAAGPEGRAGGGHKRARSGGGAVCEGFPGAPGERPAPGVRQDLRPAVPGEASAHLPSRLWLTRLSSHGAHHHPRPASYRSVKGLCAAKGAVYYTWMSWSRSQAVLSTGQCKRGEWELGGRPACGSHRGSARGENGSWGEGRHVAHISIDLSICSSWLQLFQAIKIL